MSVVERKYCESLAGLTGLERVERVCSLFGSIYEMLKLQIGKKNSSLSGRALRIKVAERLYMSDAGVQSLLKKAQIN